MATYEENSSAEMLELLKAVPEWEAANVQIAEAKAFVETTFEVWKCTRKLDISFKNSLQKAIFIFFQNFSLFQIYA